MIGVIASNTFREVMRDRVWFVLLGFGMVLLVATRLITPLALGEGPRITVDLRIPGAGGYYDPVDLPGLATVTADMMREGTTSRSSSRSAPRRRSRS